DGIRDFHVTGVQTCALPICRNEKNGNSLIVSTAGYAHAPSTRGPSQTIRLDLQPKPTAPSHHQASIAAHPWRRIASGAYRFPARSEERRVGKECRARGRARQ